MTTSRNLLLDLLLDHLAAESARTRTALYEKNLWGAMVHYGCGHLIDKYNNSQAADKKRMKKELREAIMDGKRFDEEVEAYESSLIETGATIAHLRDLKLENNWLR